MAALSLVMSYLSWRLVEPPFRQGKATIFKRQSVVFWSSGLSGLPLMAVALVIVGGNGFPGRFAPIRKGSAEYAFQQSQKASARTIACHTAVARVEDRRNVVYTIFSPPEPASRITVLGDSHADVILPAFEAIGKTHHVAKFGMSGFPGLIGIDITAGHFTPGTCGEFAENALEFVAANAIDTVFLVAR